MDKRLGPQYAGRVPATIYFGLSLFQHTQEPPTKTPSSLLIVLGIVLADTPMSNISASAADASPAGKLYELRVYHTIPGKLEALHARFRDHTLVNKVESTNLKATNYSPMQ